MPFKVLITLLFLTVHIYAEVVKVAASNNVMEVLKAITVVFENEHPDVKIDTYYSSSSDIVTQINRSNSYDMFLSSNMKYPQILYENGKAVEKPAVYAQGLLAFLSNKKRNPCKEETILNDEDIKKIAISDPQSLSYGKATVEALKNAHLYNKHKEKFLLGNSESQTVFHSTVTADIGIVPLSALHSKPLSAFREGIHWWEVNEELYTPVLQGMVLLSQKNTAKVFYNFVLSQKAKEIFVQYGYKPTK